MKQCLPCFRQIPAAASPECAAITALEVLEPWGDERGLDACSRLLEAAAFVVSRLWAAGGSERSQHSPHFQTAARASGTSTLRRHWCSRPPCTLHNHTVKTLLPDGQIGHLVHPRQPFSLSSRDLQQCLRASAGC
ncbi:hypothetical protein WJX77_008490 [Trebouxia sp. C0004]